MLQWTSHVYKVHIWYGVVYIYVLDGNCQKDNKNNKAISAMKRSI
jgi:hypothetical protein